MKQDKIECIITGCDLDEPSIGRAHGDLFQVGQVYIFNAICHKGEVLWNTNMGGDPKRITIGNGADYFERRGVFVIPKSSAMLSQAAIDYVSKPRS